MSKFENSKNKLAKAALSAVLLLTGCVQLVSPAMAQYSGQVQEDSLLPPEVVPFEPTVARQMAEAQAKARAQASEMVNSASYGQNSAMMGDPSSMNGMSGGMSNGMPGGMTSQQARQDMMNNLMSQGNGGGQTNMSSPASVPGTPGQSDWIMPGQNANAPMTAFGNVSQTQTLTAPPANPPVRRSISRGGLGMAGSALATFGAGALVGSMVRGRAPLYGLGMTGLMMSGFGTRGAFRF